MNLPPRARIQYLDSNRHRPDAGFTATVNSRLKVGDVSEVVKVEGEPVIDLQNNETSTTFDQTLLQDIRAGATVVNRGADAGATVALSTLPRQ